MPHFLWTDGSGPVDFARLRKALALGSTLRSTSMRKHMSFSCMFCGVNKADTLFASKSVEWVKS